MWLCLSGPVVHGVRFDGGRSVTVIMVVGKQARVGGQCPNVGATTPKTHKKKSN